jgi:hypothetical protein
VSNAVPLLQMVVLEGVTFTEGLKLEIPVTAALVAVMLFTAIVLPLTGA